MQSSDNLLAAFNEGHVQRLTGLTKSQLRYWDRTGFFSPSLLENEPGAPRTRLYAFRDIVGLRILGMLRFQNNVPLQQLRKVAERLSISQPEHWARTTLYVLNRKVIFQEPGTEKPQEVVTGQYIIGIALKRIVSYTSKEVDGLRVRTDDHFGHLSKSRGVAQNRLVVAGTRIPVRLLVELHEDGYSVEDIIAEYPDLTVKDVKAALAQRSTAA